MKQRSTRANASPARVSSSTMPRSTSKASRGSAHTAPPQCSNCGTTTTPVWRRGANKEKLCNACGLYFKSHRASRGTEVNRPGVAGGSSFGHDDAPQPNPSTKPTFRVKTSPPSYSSRKIGAPIQLPSIPSWPLLPTHHQGSGSSSSSGIQLPAITTLQKSSSPTGSTGLLPYRTSTSATSGGESEGEEERERGRESKWQLPSLSLPLPSFSHTSQQQQPQEAPFHSHETTTAMMTTMTSSVTAPSSSFSASSQLHTYSSKNAQPIHAFDEFTPSPPSTSSSQHHQQHTPSYGSTTTTTNTTSLPHLYPFSYLPPTTSTTSSSPPTSLSLPSLSSTPTSYSPPSDDGDWFFNSSTPHLHPLQLHDFGAPPNTSSSSFSSTSGGSGIGEREAGESDASSTRLDTPSPRLHSHAFYRGPSSMSGKNESEKAYYDIVRRRDSLVEIGSPAMGYLGYGY